MLLMIAHTTLVDREEEILLPAQAADFASFAFGIHQLIGEGKEDEEEGGE